MLSRTANNIYWLSRYMERAENLARILEVADRMSKMPNLEGEGHYSEWRSAMIISGCEPLFEESGLPADAVAIVDFIARSEENPSSIYCCIQAARENGRAVRTKLTTEMWETLNDTWLGLEQRWNDAKRRGEIRAFLDWVKERSTLFRGTLYGTMLRDEAYYFSRLGTFLERADNTARILDVKYHVLLPEGEDVGGGVDHYQWMTVLRAVSALRSYHYLYRENPKPWKIAELLVLRREMPRSLVSCMGEIMANLEGLAEQYGGRSPSHRLAGKMFSELKFTSAEEVFQGGLHEFLTKFISRNNRLGEGITRDYMFTG